MEWEGWPGLVSPVEELCSRLIAVSVEKIVHSKQERGGAKLHKNLLILHLLKSARSHQRRSSSPTEFYCATPGSDLAEASYAVPLGGDQAAALFALPDLPEQEEEVVEREVEAAEVEVEAAAEAGGEEDEASSEAASSSSGDSDSEGPSSPDSSDEGGREASPDEAPEGLCRRKRKRPAAAAQAGKRTRTLLLPDQEDHLSRLISVFNSVELLPLPDPVPS